MKLNIEIDGKPISQGRPRFVNGRVIDPPESRNEKKRIGLLAMTSMIEHGWKKTEKPVKVLCTFYGAHGLCDLDNLSKLILDSLKDIVWKDDRQVHELFAQKLKDGEPRTFVCIEEME